MRDTSGLGRAIRDLPRFTVPKQLDSQLIHKLLRDAPAFYLWATTCPLPNNLLLGKVDAINNNLDSAQGDGMTTFIE